MSDRVEFHPPKGVVPEDIHAGDTFDLVTTYRLKPNGEVCLVQVGDQKMPGYDEDEYNEKASETRQDYSGMAQSMQSAMSQASAEGAGGGGY